jgi:hypothetical protein
MRKYFPQENWFRCETCDHMFTVRVPPEATQAEEEHLLGGRTFGQRLVWDD